MSDDKQKKDEVLSKNSPIFIIKLSKKQLEILQREEYCSYCESEIFSGSFVENKSLTCNKCGAFIEL